MLRLFSFQQMELMSRKWEWQIHFRTGTETRFPRAFFFAGKNAKKIEFLVTKPHCLASDKEE